MSYSRQPYLPPEILDQIVDFLHDEPETLKECCLVSISWIPRTRKHLFVDVEFDEDDFEAWKRTFPDPSRSPARHTRNLVVHCAADIAVADVGGDSLLQAFSCVVRLELGLDKTSLKTPDISLVPFYNFSPSLKSLRLSSLRLPRSQVFGLIQSLPLLEDLTLTGYNTQEGAPPPVINTSTSPALTGTLDLDLLKGTESVTRRLLGLPNGLHFRRLIFSHRCKNDSLWMEELVAACSDTLECLDVAYRFSDLTSPVSIDLSKAKKLEDAIFWPGSLRVDWITQALRTITPKHLDIRQISIRVHHSLFLAIANGTDGQIIRGEFCKQWLELDRLLVRLWESHSIRLRFIHMSPVLGIRSRGDCYGRLLPEAAKRGIVDVVK